MDSKGNDSVYEKFGISFKSGEINYEVVEVVKCSTPTRLSYVERTYKSGVNAVRVTERPLKRKT